MNPPEEQYNTFPNPNTLAVSIEQRQARLIQTASWCLLAIVVAFSALYAFVGIYVLLWLNLFALVACIASFPVLKHFGPLAAATVCTAGGYLCLTSSLAISGGFQGRFLLWLVVIPLIGGLLGGMRSAVVWTCVTLATVFLFYYAEPLGISIPTLLPTNYKPFMILSQRLGILAAVVVMMFSYLRSQAWFQQQTEGALTALVKEVEHRRKAEIAAHRASRTKSEFLANMSHELRTPLHSILGYAELMHERAVDEDDEEAQGDLAKIETAGKQLLYLLNGVLDLSKVESGKMELNIQEVLVQDLVDEVLLIVHPEAQKRGNELLIEIEDGVEAFLTDQTKVRQILINLLSNSAKFTENGEISLSVSPSQKTFAEDEKEKRCLLFQVSDSGVGIEAEKLEDVFKAFEQASPDTMMRFGGTGLGLAIARQFTAMLRGVIEVESEPGEGSVFRLYLPILE